MTTKDQDLAVLKVMGKQLTRSLTDNISKDSDVVIEYKTEEGRIIGHGLLKEDDVAIQKIFSSKGSKLEFYIHKVREWLIVTKGKYSITIDTGNGLKKKILIRGDSVYMEPGTSHSAEALEDTYLIAITVPSDGGYPNARPVQLHN